MALDPRSGGRFGEADVRLAEAIGQQAAVAIENARLYDRARREASTSRALLRVTRAMNASLRLEEILQLVVDSVAELIGTPAAAVYLVGADGAAFERGATRALAPESIDPAALARDGSLAGLVVGGEGPSVVADTRDRPDLRFPTLRDGAAPRSVAVAPIRLGDRALGVVEAYSTEPNHFAEDDVALLGAFADQAATAIEAARLFGQARDLALLQERDRIAKELHDGIIQTIYAVGLNLDYCRLALREDPDEVERRLGEASRGLNQAIADIRGYILDLTRRVGGEPDLREAVRALAREYGTAGPDGVGMTVGVDVDDSAATLSPERRSEVVQVAREALANASRHARATAVSVEARADGRRFVLTVVDDGIGFDAGAAPADGHRGLRNMADRARSLDGYLDVRSSPGRGTRVELVVPLTP
jgi:signal transduction histidine kinase